MACAEQHIERKESYRKMVDFMQLHFGRGILNDDLLRELHFKIVGLDDPSYSRTLPPYCNDPDCHCHRLT